MLFEGLKDAARSSGLQVTVNWIGSMGTIFFTKDPVRDFASAKLSDQNIFRQYYLNMLKRGIYLAPSPFEACFVSTAHGRDDIQKTIDYAQESFKAIK